MIRKLFKALLVRAGEIIGAVLLVLVFFVASLSILGLSFPKGTSLADLMNGSGWTGPQYESPVLDLNLDSRGSPFVARLSDVYRKVKDKRPDWIAWGDSHSGTPLEARHAIQTYGRSGATISFKDKSQVVLGEDSLLVIRANESKEARSAGAGTSSLLIAGGEVAGTAGGGDGRTPMELITSSGTARIAGRSATAEFKVSVNPDESSTFSVFRGSADVSAAGRTVQVLANETVTVEAGRPPGDPTALPGAPVAQSPAPDAVFPFHTVPPRVRLEWSAADRAEAYRLEIARDRRFHDLVNVEKTLPGTEFTHGNLTAGVYYWRVTALVGWAGGRPSAVRRFEVVEDHEPPPLQVEFPEEPVDADRVLLRGATEHGSEVYVGKERVETDESGRFEVLVSLNRGVNVVVVEALDGAGNTSYRSGLLDARY